MKALIPKKKEPIDYCMTVQQLIDLLLLVEDKSRVVVLQKDAEGNGYSPLEGIEDNVVYEPQSTWSGGVTQELTPELRAMGYSDEDVGEGYPCLVLYPIN